MQQLSQRFKIASRGGGGGRRGGIEQRVNQELDRRRRVLDVKTKLNEIKNEMNKKALTSSGGDKPKPKPAAPKRPLDAAEDAAEDADEKCGCEKANNKRAKMGDTKGELVFYYGEYRPREVEITKAGGNSTTFVDRSCVAEFDSQKGVVLSKRGALAEMKKAVLEYGQKRGLLKGGIVELQLHTREGGRYIGTDEQYNAYNGQEICVHYY